MYKNCRKDFFHPKNPEKYAGDPKNIIYRSNLERRLMRRLDEDPRYTKWASEEHAIVYISPIDNRPHRYFIDMIVETVNKEVFFIEVKPAKQCVQPVKKKNTKAYMRELQTWAVNSAKWDAAIIFAKKRGGKFIILTENDLRNG